MHILLTCFHMIRHYEQLELNRSKTTKACGQQVLTLSQLSGATPATTILFDAYHLYVPGAAGTTRTPGTKLAGKKGAYSPECHGVVILTQNAQIGEELGLVLADC